MAKLDRHLVSLTAPASFAAEQYQGLRLTIERVSRSRDVKVIAVSSPAAGDGKTVTSINLAGALARGSSDRVLLIDADLRRPSIGTLLGIGREMSGLADTLSQGGPAFGDLLQSTPLPNLSVLTAGSARGGVSELLRSASLEKMLRDARQQYAYVVIDTPPLLPVFDTALLAKLVDAMLLVVSANQTPRKLLGEALNMLEPSKVLGIVFNRDERPLFGYYNSYNRYYREYFTDASQVASGA
jgi:capsular exopolysaccharide synthesis family protein